MLSYMTYFSNKVNSENQKGKTHEYFKVESYFKALALFDLVISKLNDRSNFDFRKCMVIAQTCIFMASKIHDIYSVEFSKIEQNERSREQIQILEKEILRMVNFEIMFNTEIDFVDSIINEVSRYVNIDKQLVRKTSIQMLATALQNEQFRCFSSKELVYSTVLSTICLIKKNESKTMNDKQIIQKVVKKVLDN